MPLYPKDLKVRPSFGAVRLEREGGFQPWAEVDGAKHQPSLHYASEADAIAAAKSLYIWHQSHKDQRH